MTDTRGGLKEHFFWDDDGKPGSIDYIILTLNKFLENAQEKPASTSARDERMEEINLLNGYIANRVKAKLGDKTDDFVKFCSENYREILYRQAIEDTYLKKIKKDRETATAAEMDKAKAHAKAEFPDSRIQELRTLVSDGMKKFSGEDLMILQAFISKREQLWGTVKRTAKNPKIKPADDRDVAWMKSVIQKLFEAKAVVEKAAETEPSWKKNKLKVVTKVDGKRKVRTMPETPSYNLDDVKKALGIK